MLNVDEKAEVIRLRTELAAGWAGINDKLVAGAGAVLTLQQAIEGLIESVLIMAAGIVGMAEGIAKVTDDPARRAVYERVRDTGKALLAGGSREAFLAALATLTPPSEPPN
jgi:hypothetical protein